MIEDEDEETKITDSNNIIKNIIGSKIYNKF